MCQEVSSNLFSIQAELPGTDLELTKRPLLRVILRPLLHVVVRTQPVGVVLSITALGLTARMRDRDVCLHVTMLEPAAVMGDAPATTVLVVWAPRNSARRLELRRHARAGTSAKASGGTAFRSLPGWAYLQKHDE
jgi:hypothetical protein